MPALQTERDFSAVLSAAKFAVNETELKRISATVVGNEGVPMRQFLVAIENSYYSLYRLFRFHFFKNSLLPRKMMADRSEAIQSLSHFVTASALRSRKLNSSLL